MNHLEASSSGKNNLWRYLLMLAVVYIIANTIGAIPFISVLIVKELSDPEIVSQALGSQGNMSMLGVSQNANLIIMLSPFLAGLAAFVILIKQLHGRSISETINGTKKIRWSRFFISAIVWLIISAVYFFIYLKLNPSNFTLNNKSVSLIYLTVISLLMIPFQAAFEEIIFRGYLMQGFSLVLKNRWFPLIMTSLSFGLLHAFNPEVKEFGFLTMMPQYIMFGLIFGIVTIIDDGVELALGAHAANNIFLCVMVTAESSALQTPALFKQESFYPWTEFTGLVVSGIVFILVLYAIFKWKNFSVLIDEVKNYKTIQTP
jgi:uncharacterized protein